MNLNEGIWSNVSYADVISWDWMAKKDAYGGETINIYIYKPIGKKYKTLEINSDKIPKGFDRTVGTNLLIIDNPDQKTVDDIINKLTKIKTKNAIFKAILKLKKLYPSNKESLNKSSTIKKKVSINDKNVKKLVDQYIKKFNINKNIKGFKSVVDTALKATYDKGYNSDLITFDNLIEIIDDFVAVEDFNESISEEILTANSWL